MTAATLSVYERALLRAATGRSAPLVLHDHLGGRSPLDPRRWCRPHLRGDAGLLARCAGPTLDVGCGPGRLTAALNLLGRTALGIDVSAAAIRLAHRRGATALRRDVFRPLPGHGRWADLLLADGNIGIGGDPVALLARCRDLLAPDGRLHVELAPPRTRSWSGPARLSLGATSTRSAGGSKRFSLRGTNGGSDGCSDGSGGSDGCSGGLDGGSGGLDGGSGGGEFRWAVVAAPDLAALASAAALRTLESWTEAGRWFATLTPA